MLILSLSEKGGESKQLQFEKTEVTLGRVQGNEIVLPKGNVSKRHCRITVADGRFMVEDMKSTNGTYVNGRKIGDPVQIFQGDKIYIGDFVVKIENAPSPEAASLGNEAGSLSSALGNRRAPGARATGAMSAVPDAMADAGQGRRATLPPPPPPPRLPSEAPAAPPAATDINLDDDEPLATRPPRSAVPPAPPPPARPAAPPAPTPLFNAPPAPAPARSTMLDHEDVATGGRGRGAVAASTISNPANPAGWVSELLADATIAAVFVLGPDSVEIERGGRREPVQLGEAEIAALGRTLADLAVEGGAAAAGVVDVIVRGDTRFTAVFPPLATQICASLRRAAEGRKRLSDLADDGTLTGETRELLRGIVAQRRNLLLAGEAGATHALLDALVREMPATARVIAAEGRVRPADPGQPWVNLTPDGASAGLLGAAVSARPDFLVVDLGAYGLAGDVVAALAQGHQGSLVSLPARSALDALERLYALAGSAVGEGDAARRLVASAFEAIVHVGTLPDGKPRVFEVAEPAIDDSGRLSARLLLVTRNGALQTTGVESRLARTLAARGAEVAALGG